MPLSHNEHTKVDKYNTKKNKFKICPHLLYSQKTWQSNTATTETAVHRFMVPIIS